MATIADMTMEDLKQLILDLMEEQRLSHLFGTAEMEESGIAIDEEPDQRSMKEVFASVERNRWTPPAGSPTPAEMIREDRDEH